MADTIQTEDFLLFKRFYKFFGTSCPAHPLSILKGGFSVSLDLSEQYDKIYRYCYFKVNDRSAAEDLTQETFLRYFSQTSYISRGKQLAYLYTIARNLCVDFYRNPRRQEEGLEVIQESGSTAKSREIAEKLSESPMEQVETALHLQMAVGQLPAEQQELILLRYANGLSIKEICRITGLSRSSVYRMEKSAMQRLRRLLE